ncbi:putative transcriptional regulator, MerR family [Flavobacterium psychrophilum]|uniref:MerR family transcriptional regulator n=1 Tax=Flavobacterium psychrophilum TaxID=96345 RepID=UPI000B7C1263|nr:MerR family transcriptional regulator [Flavobacterium psychrophilum]EKT3965610.1 MerR family transcriptional regulator [Flavobacterium psychrophilum]SNA88048.1 putative transcriptional regulator, MerR family [Flavobacterium psychrophilum]SNB29919.1 putative transcriptional regulator, MerR family [Flavobacterium psychrophilum]
MNAVKTIFSIKDLENLSGIKAHTIRIWEKRYSILEPMRTDTNIRLYDIHNLQKLLNITLLHDYGYKISRISKLSPDKIPALVREIVSEKSAKSHAINAFKMAMMNFDQTLFINTYNNLLLEKSFRAVFYEVFIPLMNEIGLLWQSNTITIAHEHFITHLIKQKLVTNIEKIQVLEPTRTDTIFVLYLPSNEIHELGLMYLNYEFILSGYKTIYLGESVPIESLKDIQRYFDKITFVSYMTVQPTKDEINNYIEKIKTEILGENSSECWFIGKMTTEINPEILNKKTKIFQSIASIIEEI